MKNLLFVTCLTITLLCGCKGGNNNDANAAYRDSMANISNKNKIVKESPRSVLDTIKWNGKVYYSSIERSPADSLPTVKDDQGTTYNDNIINLKITCDGGVVINKTFKKSMFKGYIEPDFYKISVLEGLVFDKTVGNGMQFAVSIANPSQEDEFVAFSVVVNKQGETSLKRDDNLDTSEQDEEGDE